MTRLKVLVVEDDSLVRLCTAELLDEAGFEVVEASNAEEALRTLEHEDGVRVLFTDVDIPPGDNGLELARKVHRQWPEIGLVITSGYSMFAHADLPDSGRFVAKAAPPEVVVKVIEQAAQLHTAPMLPG
jgi:CheY-like chemotaxis protein